MVSIKDFSSGTFTLRHFQVIFCEYKILPTRSTPMNTTTVALNTIWTVFQFLLRTLSRDRHILQYK